VLGALRGHADVLQDPAPSVFMTDARDGALEFNAFAYVASPRQAFGVKSALLFQIVPDLKTAGIPLASSAATVRVTLEPPGALAPTPPHG
jgi:small-conductance mechanosensitive channel